MQGKPLMSSETEEEFSTLFKNVSCWIDPQVGCILETKLNKILKSSGARIIICSKGEHLNSSHKTSTLFLEGVTHIISFNHSIPGFELSDLPNVTLVTPDWVLRSYKYQKLYSPEYYSPDPSRIFSGMVLATSQLPVDDSEIIFGAVSALGGQFRRAFVSDVTHLITTQPGGPKYEKAISDESEAVIVSPHWFDDCLRLRKRLPELHYSFPNPTIFAPYAEDTLNNIDKRCSPLLFRPVEAAGSNPEKISSEIPATFLSEQVFFLDDDLNISSENFSSLKKQLLAAGAKISLKFDSKITCYVCPFRKSKFYDEALSQKLVIGNLTWLIHILLSRKFDSPFSQLLFYPVVRSPAKSMDNLSISFTNYCTGAREYLQRMALAMGATCTPHLSPSNTHLVCASPSGLKYEKALEWNVVVVNHLWIEDSYRLWCCQAVTKPQYTHFPVGVNLDHLVSQAPYHPNDIKQIQSPGTPNDSTLKSESDIVHESDASQPIVPLSPNPSQTDLKTSSKINSSAKPESSYRKPSRMAASSASQALAKLMETQNEYEKKLKSKPKSLSTPALPIKDLEENAIIPPSPKIPKQNDAKPSSRRSKRISIMPVASNDKPEGKRSTKPSSQSVEEPTKKKSKTKVSEKSSLSIFKILFTGIKPSSEEKKAIRTLGGKIVETTEDCTHLVAQSAMRTAKLVSAISRCRIIVSKEWLTKSIDSGFFLDETSYILKDPESEKQYGFSLEVSLKRAQKSKLLEEYEVAISPSVYPSPAVLKTIIEAAGGKVVATFPAKRLISKDGSKLSGSNYKLLIVGDIKDRSFLSGRLGTKVFTSSPPVIIYKTELIMSGTLRQELDLSSTNYLEF